MGLQVVGSTYSLESTVQAAWTGMIPSLADRDSWVKLLKRPSDYSADEAKLLCQDSPDTWVAWVPYHGEVILSSGDFYR